MIRLCTDFEPLYNELSEVIRLFIHDEPISAETGDTVVRHTHEVSGDTWIEVCEMPGARGVAETPALPDGADVTETEHVRAKRMIKRAAKTACFRMLQGKFGYAPPWGSLTGIRPTRVLREIYDEGLSGDDAERALIGRFYVSPRKARLLTEICVSQEGKLEVPKGQFDLYIGIPFCVTRCAYCAFPADELGDGRQTDAYLDALVREMRASAAMTKGLSVRAAYVGGGTPTSLTADQLARLLGEMNECFPGYVELTVEAGRPDTITPEKLRAIRDGGARRVSVNPQSFSDDTLVRIGRAHTAKDTLEGFRMARDAGFGDINMDLIAALPGETGADFERTLDITRALNPESVTVHTLAIKRSSRLHEVGYEQAPAEEAARMVDRARDALAEGGYRPYYLYRQKYMAGNLENVGYAKPGFECLYNIGNMEETAPVLALGAGAITKWLFPRERRIERASNVRNVSQYVERVDEMIERKRALLST